MTNEEARDVFAKAVGLFDDREYAEALVLLDVVDKHHPNSRHINFYRGMCLAKLDRVKEAEVCKRRIQGRIKPDDLQRINDAIDNAEYISRSRDNVPVEHYVAPPSGENIFVVQSVFPVSTEECSVLGTVKKGTFHVDDIANVIGPGGSLLPAPITGIRTADTPVLLAREGQHLTFVLRISPEQVHSGASITCETHRNAHAATIMVRPDAPDENGTLERPAELAPVEKIIKQGNYREANRLLRKYISEHPTNMFAKRMLAQLYLEKDSSLHNPAKALFLIQTVYQAGGAEDPGVVNILANAQAETGQPKMGLRFLENLFATITDAEAQQALAQRIHDFRNKYDLGSMWEFSDDLGEVIFKSSDSAEMIRAIVNGVVPLNATCRRNSIGDFTPIETTLSPLFPEVAALFKPKKQQWNSGFLILLALLLLGILLALLLPSLTK